MTCHRYSQGMKAYTRAFWGRTNVFNSTKLEVEKRE